MVSSSEEKHIHENVQLLKLYIYINKRKKNYEAELGFLIQPGLPG